MAIQVGYNFYFKITPNGGSATDLSDHIKSMATKNPIEVKEYVVSPGGAPGAAMPPKNRVLGVRDNQLDVTFMDDRAASSVRATLELAYGAPCAIEFGFYGNVAGATTPIYSYTAIFSDLPEGGGVAELLEIQVTFMISSGVRTIDTTP